MTNPADDSLLDGPPEKVTLGQELTAGQGRFRQRAKEPTVTPAQYAEEALREWRGGGNIGDTRLDDLVKAACDAVAAQVSRVAAAYVQDRSEQYDPSACCRVGLEDAAAGLRRFSHLAAYQHGELDDLLKLHNDIEAVRVQRMLAGAAMTPARSPAT